MKLKIEKDILLENLNAVSKAMSTRNINPVLNGIKFELTKKGLSLTATNNDITIKSFIDKSNIKEIKEEGTSIIYGRYLLDIVRKLSENLISIEEVDGNKAMISTKNSKYSLNCFPEADFPKIDLKETSDPIVLSSSTLKEIINQTSFATSLQESRPLLTGINIKIVGNILECVATDSYRLAKKVIQINKTLEESVNIVIPARNIIELLRIIELEENIEIHTFNNKVLFKYKDILFQSSLLSGTYPNTDNFVPKEFELEIEVNTNEFYNVVDRASLFAQSKDKNTIQISIDKNNLVINSYSQEAGKVEEKMEIVNPKNGELKISCSAKYLLEALKTFESENIKLYFNGQIKPIIIKENDKGDLIQLILPIMTY